MREAEFLAGVFFDFLISRQNQFLLKYFRTKIEIAFLKYYLCFGEIEYFTEHTGWYCQKRWLRILVKRFNKIIKAHTDFKSNLELDKLRELESGKYKY